jgi:glyoxylase-like metal-dependent hydrolase (beta-lactamase superfamily II)
MVSDTGGEISPEKLAALLDDGEAVHLLDVRNRDELDAWRIDGPGVDLTHVPYMKFLSARAAGDPADLVDPEESYVAVCPRGEESAEVAETLAAAGVDVKNLADGMHGWARVYAREQVAGPDPTIWQYRRPASGCLAYAVVSAGEALVVDPLRAFTDRYPADLLEVDADLTHVLDTHVHADHFSGLQSLADETGATPLISADAAARGLEFEAETISDDDVIEVGDCAVEVLSTPGHTTGAISLLVDGVLLSGDSLFLDGTPRPDLQSAEADPRGLAEQLHETLTERLAELPAATTVAPGHVPPERVPVDGTHAATLGDLRERIPAFSQDQETFVERILDSLGSPPANYEQIIAVNLGQETVDEDDAFELELGPNNCAVAAE